jgi:hypothetical protein
MNKYIFMYEANYPSNPEGFSFVDADESTLEDAVRKFLEEMPNITKLIVVDIKHTYKVPIELYK